VAQQLLHFDLYDVNSNQVAANAVRQQRFLANTATRLLSTPAEVVREMEEFRAFITQPHRMRYARMRPFVVAGGRRLEHAAGHSGRLMGHFCFCLCCACRNVFVVSCSCQISCVQRFDETRSPCIGVGVSLFFGF